MREKERGVIELRDKKLNKYNIKWDCCVYIKERSHAGKRPLD